MNTAGWSPPGHGIWVRPAPGRDKQRVVRKLAAVIEQHGVSLRVHALYKYAGEQRDLPVLVLRDRAHKHLLLAHDTLEEPRQRDAVIQRIRSLVSTVMLQFGSFFRKVSAQVVPAAPLPMMTYLRSLVAKRTSG